MTAAGDAEFEIRLLLEAIFHKYQYDFRDYAMASLKRRLTQAVDKLGARTVSGPVANYRSLSSFQVRNQEVDASGPAVVFNGGTAADLRNGRQVTVTGTWDGELLTASEVSFAP